MSNDLEQIYREHATTVYRYLFSLTNNSDLAEELTQETFYRAINSIGTYNGTCKISVWLCQIAKHIWYQELDRKKKRATEKFDENTPSNEMSPEDATVFKDDKLALYRAINLLSVPMREVVYMRITGELSFAEIGEIMNKNETWARVTFYRAKQKLMEDR